MTHSLPRRLVVLAAVLGTALVAACTNPTAPSASDAEPRADAPSLSGGIYGGSSTR